MNTKQTVNPEPATEYHLRAMGIADRADYRIIAADERLFSDGVNGARASSSPNRIMFYCIAVALVLWCLINLALSEMARLVITRRSSCTQR